MLGYISSLHELCRLGIDSQSSWYTSSYIIGKFVTSPSSSVQDTGSWKQNCKNQNLGWPIKYHCLCTCRLYLIIPLARLQNIQNFGCYHLLQRSPDNLSLCASRLAFASFLWQRIPQKIVSSVQSLWLSNKGQRKNL